MFYNLCKTCLFLPAIVPIIVNILSGYLSDNGGSIINVRVTTNVAFKKFSTKDYFQNMAYFYIYPKY